MRSKAARSGLPVRSAAARVRGRVRRVSLRRSLRALPADQADALIKIVDEADLWDEFTRVARRADIDAVVRSRLIERAVACGRPHAVQSLRRPSDEPSRSAFDLGRAYEQAGRWGSAAAAFRRAATLTRTQKAAWTARFYRMVAKEPWWGFETEPYGPAWRFPRRAERPRTGVVAPLDTKLLVGWLPPDEGSHDQVVIRLNGVRVAETYATTPVTLPDGREYRQFTRWIGGLWTYAGAGDVITVHARGATLPFITREHRHIVATGVSRADELFARLEEGYTIDKAGRLRMSLRYDGRWQQNVFELFTTLRDDIQDGLGHVIFPFYGTLLGAVREGDFIRYDNDFDAAYISAHSTPRKVRDEFLEVARFLLRRGYVLEPRRPCVWVYLPGTDTKIDLFYTWFGTDGLFSASYGYHGRQLPRTGEFFEYRTRRLGAFEVAVTRNAEDVVAQLYGEGWRRPDPGFLQQGASRVVDTRFQLHTREVSDLWWSVFHRDQEPPVRESGFARYIADRLGSPGAVVEFGCGTGRDSIYLARCGWTAVASDRSPTAISRAEAAAASQPHGPGAANFEIVDVASADAVRAHLARHAAVLDGSQPVVYLRALLHAIDEAAERTLLRTLAQQLDQGFVLAAEFTTPEDQRLAKAYRDHYWRYIDHRRFAERLATEYGFRVDHLEARQGSSPVDGADAYVARLVARLPARSQRAPAPGRAS